MSGGDSSNSVIRIGVSQCLLGERVRHDGGHKRDQFLTETLGRYFEWVPVCPEVEVGMGIPRETIQLVELDDGLHLLGTRSRTDHTLAMRRYARERVRELEPWELRGYILKKDSPSCGMERVRVHRPEGQAVRDGRGLFATALLEQFPNLPVEEEGRLCDPRLRENWVERVFAYDRLKRLWAGEFPSESSRGRKSWSLGDLVAFHTAHKLTLLAHSPPAYRALGNYVARAKTMGREPLRNEYEHQFMDALRKMATPGRHANVLQHMAGYFRDELDAPSRQELTELIESYRRGLLPLVVPLTLIRHYVRRFDVAYLKSQSYLNPHPQELMLRNHV